MRALFVLAISFLPTVAYATPFPSLSCVFNEPFVSVQVWPNDMRFTYEGLETVTEVARGGSEQEPIIQARVGGKPTTLTIINEPGSDVMSDITYPLHGRLSGWILGPGRLGGGCMRYAQGSKPQRVIGLSQDGRLNIRTRASRRSQVVGVVDAREEVWLVPGNARNGWVSVAFSVAPKNENGPMTLVQGWARARYFSQVR